MPFPREEVTPPVTKTYFAIWLALLRGFFQFYGRAGFLANWLDRGSAGRRVGGHPADRLRGSSGREPGRKPYSTTAGSRGCVPSRRVAPAVAPDFGATDERPGGIGPVSYTRLRAHETRHDLVC